MASVTIRDDLNSAVPGRIEPALAALKIGDTLNMLLGASGTDVPTTTVGAAVSQTGATVTTADGSDPTTTQALANALKADYNKTITDVAALVARVNQIRTDVLAIRTAVVGAAGVTEQGLSPSANVVTLAHRPSALLSVVVTAGTSTGVKVLLEGPVSGAGALTPAAGFCVWDGGLKVRLAAADVATTVDVLYARADSASISALSRSLGEQD